MSPDVMPEDRVATTVTEPGTKTDRAHSRARAARKRKLGVGAARALLLVAVLGLWEALSRAKVIDPFNFSMPSKIWDQIWTWVMHGTALGSLGEQIWFTLQEALLGWIIGVIAGVVFGIALGRIAFLADVLGPYIKVLNSIPRIVLAPIFMIWFGLGPASKVASAVVLVFFPVFFNAFQGARDVDPGLIANARILGASRTAVLAQVVLPSAFSWIIASLRVAFGLAITGAVVGEIIGATQGLGLLIEQSQGNFDPDGVYAGLVVTTVLAAAAEGLITLLERRLLRWKPRRRTSPSPTT